MFREISQISPDYIAVSYVCEKDYCESLPYIDRMKKMGIPLIAGGVYIRRGVYVPEGLFDYICRGEGEILPNFFLSGDTQVFDEKYNQANLDNLPLPDYSNITGFEFARDYPFLQGLKIIPYSGSRGCPFKCGFCETQYQNKTIRIRTSIREDLDYLYERYMPDLFYFLDELLPYYNDEWLSTFEGNTHPFMCYIRADISPQTLRFLYDNGMRICAFGIESGDELYRNEVLKKGLSDAEIWRTITILKEFGIQYIPFFMRNTPYETEEIKTATIEMYNKIGGFPQIWEYEDLSKRVCSLPVDSVKKYSKKMGIEELSVWNAFRLPQTGIKTNGKSFFSYELLEDAVFIQHVWGDGKWAWPEMVKLCKQYNKKNVRAVVMRDGHVKGFQRKWKFDVTGYIINRGV
jgi:radical SAM superfamily enzyme YgiQ (UPF0313 family)